MMYMRNPNRTLTDRGREMVEESYKHQKEGKLTTLEQFKKKLELLDLNGQ
jgi:hypothetical protein